MLREGDDAREVDDAAKTVLKTGVATDGRVETDGRVDSEVVGGRVGTSSITLILQPRLRCVAH